MKRDWPPGPFAAILPVMPIHSAMSSRFPLLDGVPSIQALIEDPQYAELRAAFEYHPDYEAPDVSVRADAAPGPHGPVPVRVYDAGGDADGRPCLVWMQAAPSWGGTWTCPRPTGPRANWPSGPGR